MSVARTDGEFARLTYTRVPADREITLQDPPAAPLSQGSKSFSASSTGIRSCTSATKALGSVMIIVHDFSVSLPLVVARHRDQTPRSLECVAEKRLRLDRSIAQAITTSKRRLWASLSISSRPGLASLSKTHFAVPVTWMLPIRPISGSQGGVRSFVASA